MNRHRLLAVGLTLAIIQTAFPAAANEDDAIQTTNTPSIADQVNEWRFNQRTDMEAIKSQATDFYFQVNRYVYLVDNESAHGSEESASDSHCSFLVLGGKGEEGRSPQLFLYARTHSDIACKEMARGNYCSTDTNGRPRGHMIVDQSEIDTLHDRLNNQSVVGEFLVSCQSGGGVTGEGEEVRVTVIFSGFNGLNSR